MTLTDSQIFYNIAVGIGAIMGSLAGLNFIIDYLSKKKKEALINSYKRLYPREKLNSGFKLVWEPGNKIRVFIIDLKVPKKRWITSSQTLFDLGFWFEDIEDINPDEFKKSPDGKEIWTNGIPGS